MDDEADWGSLSSSFVNDHYSVSILKTRDTPCICPVTRFDFPLPGPPNIRTVLKSLLGGAREEGQGPS